MNKPTSHEKDYDLVIKMVEMSVDDILELEQQEFNQLINDEWTWKSSFRLSIYSNMSYSGSSGVSGTSGTSGTGGSSYFKSPGINIEETDNSYFIPITFSEDELSGTPDIDEDD